MSLKEIEPERRALRHCAIKEEPSVVIDRPQRTCRIDHKVEIASRAIHVVREPICQIDARKRFRVCELDVRHRRHACAVQIPEPKICADALLHDPVEFIHPDQLRKTFGRGENGGLEDRRAALLRQTCGDELAQQAAWPAASAGELHHPSRVVLRFYRCRPRAPAQDIDDARDNHRNGGSSKLRSLRECSEDLSRLSISIVSMPIFRCSPMARS